MEVEDGIVTPGKQPGMFQEGFPEAMEFHTTLPTQVGVTESGWEIIDPRNSIIASKTIEFEIPSGQDMLIDPNKTRMLLRLKLLKNDGTTPELKNTKFCPVNGLAHAIFKGLDVTLNGTRIASSDGLYAYRAHMESSLMSSKAASTHGGTLTLGGFEVDSTPYSKIPNDDSFKGGDDGKSDITSTDEWGGWKRGPIQRRFAFYRTRDLDATLISRVYSEIFDQPKYLPPGSTLRLVFYLQELLNDFALNTAQTAAKDRFKIVIEKCCLLVRRVKAQAQLLREIFEITEKGEPMKIPLRRVSMNYYTRDAGTADWGIVNLLKPGETLPRRIFIGFVKQAAFIGSYNNCPFEFEKPNIQTAGLKLGAQYLPYPEIRCYTKKDDTMPFWALMEALKAYGSEEDCGVTLFNYSRGNYYLGFNLTHGDLPPGEAFELPQNKPASLECLLNASHAGTPMTMIVYAEYDAEILIGANNQVTMKDFAI